MSGEENQIYNFPGKVRSSVWRFFGFRKRFDGPPIKQNLDMTTVICKLCMKSYANKGNTTNLQQHLDNYHRNTNIDEPKPSSSLPSISASRPAPAAKLTQPRIDAPLPTKVKTLGAEQKKKLDDLTLKLLVGKILPLSLVSNKHFQALVKELDPSYDLPSKHDIDKALIKKEVSMVEKLKKDLPTMSKGGFVAITHDGWTSCATQSYDTITVHFINKEWELRSAVLQTQKVEGSHTAQNIAGNLEEAVIRWNLPTPTVVTDNAANEVKAVQTLGWERFGCYGHRINLVVKHSLQVPEVARIIGKTRKLVGVFHQSTSVNDCLLEKQRTIYENNKSVIGHKLIQDVATRWNSCYDMLERVVEQSAAILAVASDDKLSKTVSNNVKTYCLTFEEHTIVEGLLQLLLPFKMATTILCADKAPTMSKVLLCMAKIHDSLNSTTYSSTVMKVVNVMKQQLEKRTDHEDISVMGAILNPDLKSCSFMSDEQKHQAHKLLLDKCISMFGSQGSVPCCEVKAEDDGASQTETVTSSSALPELPSLPVLAPKPNVDENDNLMSPEPAMKKIKCTDLEEWFDDVIITGHSSTSVSSLVEQEVARYLSSPRSPEDANLSLLEWWQKHELNYPRLSVLARKYLAIPASSVPSERVFSLAGNLVSKKRSRLSPEKVNSLIFLKMNMDCYW